MRKLIDIPDSIVKDLKILAVKNDKDLKNYIQDLISRHYEFSNLTEMALEAVHDGQSYRFIHNYLIKTYEGVKDQTFDIDRKYESVSDFLLDVSQVCNHIVEMIEIDEEEERKDIEDEKKLL